MRPCGAGGSQRRSPVRRRAAAPRDGGGVSAVGRPVSVRRSRRRISIRWRRACCSSARRQLQRDGHTLLFTTHIPADVRHLATRIVLLRDGRIESEAAGHSSSAATSGCSSATCGETIMKTWWPIFAWMLASATATACTTRTLSPEPLPLDRVECARCRMLISTDSGGGEIVSATEDTRFYDDVGCLAADWAGPLEPRAGSSSCTPRSRSSTSTCGSATPGSADATWRQEVPPTCARICCRAWTPPPTPTLRRCRR